MPPDYVARRAVTLLASGPTGGVMGATLAASAAGIGDFVAVDMGGTSFDICLVRDGRPEIKTDWNWRYRYYIGLPMVDVQSVGAGGGSIARVRQGALLVGPGVGRLDARARSATAAAARARPSPTPTSCSATCPPTASPAAACSSTSTPRATRSARDVAEPLGLDVIDAAWGIERIVNANMANATRKVLAGHGADPRDLALIAYGGNGAVHAWAIARELGIDRIVVPKAAPAFSRARRARRRLRRRPRALVRHAAVAGRPRPRARPHDRPRCEEVDKELDPTGLADGEVERDAVRADVLPGPELRHERAGARRRRARRARPARSRRALPRPARAERGFCFRTSSRCCAACASIARGRTPKPDHLAETGAVSRRRRRPERGTRAAYWGDGLRRHAGVRRRRARARARRSTVRR